MSSSSRSLKAQNTPWIWAVVVADSVVALAIASPSVFDQMTLSLSAILRLSTASIAPVVVLLVTSLLPPEAKAVLVFWRVHHALPGHRAFSVYATSDPRIDLQTLQRNVGKFPEAPRDQNAAWYRLYKKVETEVSVTLAHRNYLLFCDLAVLSVLLTPFVLVILVVLGVAGSAVWYAVCLFGIQYVVTAIAARNHGVRFVTNVLALHSSSNTWNNTPHAP